MLVGEQPGDMEDREGAPFVGPAGRLLDKALTEAGIDRTAAYVTNAVKHFRVTRQRGELLEWPPSAGPYAGSAVPVAAALATIHPSAVLRARTPEERESAFAGMVTDLSMVARALR